MTGGDEQSNPAQRSILGLVAGQPTTKLKPATAKTAHNPPRVLPPKPKNIPQATPTAAEFWQNLLFFQNS